MASWTLHPSTINLNFLQDPLLLSNPNLPLHLFPSKPKHQYHHKQKINHGTYLKALQSPPNLRLLSTTATAWVKLLQENALPGEKLRCNIAQQTQFSVSDGKCCSVFNEGQMLAEMPQQSVASWNAMIIGHAKMNRHRDVLKLFVQMINTGLAPDEFSFPSALKACISVVDFFMFRQMHGLAVKSGVNPHPVVGSALVDGYAKIGWVDDAILAFVEIDEKDVVSWNAALGTFVQADLWEGAWEAFHEMLKAGIAPDHFTCATLLKACAALRCLWKGRQVHAMVITSGHASDVFVANSLIDMYGKFGDLDDSMLVFETMSTKDQVSWNTLISTYSNLGHPDEALQLFFRMQQAGFRTDRFNLGSILTACISLSDARIGRALHCFLMRRLLDSDVVLGSALIDLYAKSGRVNDARIVFNKLELKNLVSWNSMIAGFVQDGRVKEALDLYHEMILQDMEPDQHTYTVLLTLCGDEGHEHQGKQIHAHILRTIAKINLVLESALVDFYVKCGRLDDARKMFDRMDERNAYSWNALITGYEQQDQPDESLNLMHQMQQAGIKPDRFSLASILSASSSLLDLDRGKQIHGYVVRNNHMEEGTICCNLIDMHSKCGNLDCAYKVYSSTAQKDVFLQNVMLSAFIGYDRIEAARNLFDQMEEKTTVSWNTMITGYNRHGCEDETFKLYKRMREENSGLDGSTLVIMLDACANTAVLRQGKQLHACIIKSGNDQMIMINSAGVNMYAKCGDIESACKMFIMMPEKNIITWNTMIAGYAKHGCSKHVMHLFNQMQQEGVKPNDITFLSVMTACSHTGLIEDGLRIFISMLEDFELIPRIEHYNCMVDLLARAGYLDHAYDIIKAMPIKADVFSWGALLGACRLHNNIALGKLAAQNLFEMDSRNPANYVLLSNIYAAAEMWEEAKEIRRRMKSKCINKSPGVSWTEIDNKIHVFQAGDEQHPLSKEIYSLLIFLNSKMKTVGYAPDTNFVLQDVDDAEDYLLHHSERLAVALGLIRLPQSSTIRVFKNLRICGDCHTAMKLISTITNREIIIRDVNRFHHFRDGICSCGDYW
uniref:DYW domain-containing protein n=2 Tax=Nymphaea colorata TaxID=210225 RepID=A0A5K1FWK0_9MAGN